MEDDIQRCGNDIRFLEWWLIHHGKDPGDPIISELAALTQAAVQVLVSSEISNQRLGREFRSEAAESLRAAANRFASAGAVAAGA
jgi:hypothetical protein